MHSPAGHMRRVISLLVFALLSSLRLPDAVGGEIRVGAAEVDITPNGPIALAGNFSTRVSRVHDTPIFAAALAIEAGGGGSQEDHVIIITCDLVAIRDGVQQKFRERLRSRLPRVDMRRVFLTATHTHTAPLTMELQEARYIYDLPK